MSGTKKGLHKGLTSYGDSGFSLFLRKAFIKGAGYTDDALDRRIVGIVDTGSAYNPCHGNSAQLIEAVKRGVMLAGGLPMDFPVISIHESFASPTSMFLRNLMSMDVEEMIRAQPMDAVVLIGGCDKTVPALLMGAASANVPAIMLVTGPMLTGDHKGERLGACTDCRRFWGRFRAGEIDEQEINAVNAKLAPSAGTCMVMGTASTMACMAESLGLMLPGGATAPSGSGDRLRHAVATGRRAVALVDGRLRPRDVLTPAAFRNALVVLSAIGGSTNAIVHLLAIARRAGVPLAVDDVHDVSARVPLLVGCKPAGAGYMEDFHRAGGVPVLMKALRSLLDVSAVGVSGRPLAALLAETAEPADWQETIGRLDTPLGPPGALVTVRGSLAPDGAVLKRAAATPGLLRHRGPAVVFDSPDDAAARIDDPALAITADHVLVLRNAGPVAAGMPEAGSLPIPRYLAAAGVRDMVRVSDARMSGTAYGTVVLHCAPEAAVGGPLALVRDGDPIELDVAARRLDLCVDAAELARRRQAFVLPALPARGWRRLYA